MAAWDDLQQDFAWMADKADGSVDLFQVQVSFLWESDNQGFSPFGRPFSCLKILLQTEDRTSIMVSPPVLTNSAGMLSTTAGFPMLSDLTSSHRIGRGSSPGIFAQSSTVGSPSVSYFCFVWFEAFRPSQQFFSHVGTEPTLPVYYVGQSEITEPYLITF